MTMMIPPLAVLIRHRVNDYDAWKRVFDGHRPSREGAGALGHHIHRGLDDPNEVHIYAAGADPEKMRAFLGSADLATAMKRAGVVSAADVTLLTPKLLDLDPERLLPGVILVHQVEDYERWSAAHDQLKAFRKKSGIVGEAVNQLLGDPNRLVVYYQGDDVVALRHFAASPRLEAEMNLAGVVGGVDVHFVQVVAFTRYRSPVGGRVAMATAG